MAQEVQVSQSSREERIYPLDFSPALLEGVTVDSMDYEHTPPEGGSPIVPTEIIDGSLVYVAVPEGLDLGVHKLSCVARTSNPDLSPEILLIVTVTR